MNLCFERSKGFTLIELSIVVAIVGILAAIAVPIFDSFSEKSKIDDLKSNMLVAATAQEKFFLSKGRYATTYEDGNLLENSFDYPKKTKDMTIRTGVILKEGVGMGYWVSGARKIKGQLHCWLYVSPFMGTSESISFREFKTGDTMEYRGINCSL